MQTDPITTLIESEQLPSSYLSFVTQYLQPLANKIALCSSEVQKTLLVGINGAQGTGKTTCCLFLQQLLELTGKKVVTLSLDDFYLSRAERQHLAETVHPLLITRGVPGTHKIELMVNTLTALQSGEQIKLPKFDKSIDDCLRESQWPVHDGDVDIILLEGWCVGAVPQLASELELPINRLERDQDPQGIWRQYVNEQLKIYQQKVFSQIDYLLVLKPPNFKLIYEWRAKQEEKLALAGGANTHIMDEKALQHFIDHYERLTKHMFATLPQKADTVFYFSNRQLVTRAAGLN